LKSTVLAPVLVGADGLRDGAIGEVGADRGERIDAEHEDEQRRHQRAAADPGHPHEHADAQPEDDQNGVHA